MLYRDLLLPVYFLHFGTQLCVPGKNFKNPPLFIIGVVHATSNIKIFTHQLVLCEQCVFTNVIMENIFKQLSTSCPFVIATGIRRVPVFPQRLGLQS
jgi:hypothetical protein